MTYLFTRKEKVMPYKKTMKKLDIERYHKMLKEGMDLKIISEALLITKATLEKFTPEIMDKIKRKQRAIRNAILQGHKSKIPKDEEKSK